MLQGELMRSTGWALALALLAGLGLGNHAFAEGGYAVKKHGKDSGEISAVEPKARLQKAVFDATGVTLTLGGKAVRVAWSPDGTVTVAGVACKTVEDAVTQLLAADVSLAGKELDALAAAFALGTADLGDPARNRLATLALERWGHRAHERERKVPPAARPVKQ
jgi:hypothetical protein